MKTRVTINTILNVCLISVLMFATGCHQAGKKDNRYDIVIYGGTSSGVAAAIQSSRMSKSVVLIEPTNRIGGLTTGGLGQTDIGNKQAIGGISRPVTTPVMNCGAPAKVYTTLNALAPITIHKTMLVNRKVRKHASFKVSQVSCRFMAAQIMEPRAPTAAPSVGVATPEKIEPRTIRISRMGRRTPRSETSFSLKLARSSGGNPGPRLGFK